MVSVSTVGSSSGRVRPMTLLCGTPGAKASWRELDCKKQ